MNIINFTKGAVVIIMTYEHFYFSVRGLVPTLYECLESLLSTVAGKKKRVSYDYGSATMIVMDARGFHLKHIQKHS